VLPVSQLQFKAPIECKSAVLLLDQPIWWQTEKRKITAVYKLFSKIALKTAINCPAFERWYHTAVGSTAEVPEIHGVTIPIAKRALALANVYNARPPLLALAEPLSFPSHILVCMWHTKSGCAITRTDEHYETVTLPWKWRQQASLKRCSYSCGSHPQ
jgi:hypothetical protein